MYGYFHNALSVYEINIGFYSLFTQKITLVGFSDIIKFYFLGVSIGLGWTEEGMRNEEEKGMILLSIHHSSIYHLSTKIDYFIGNESPHSIWWLVRHAQNP